MASERVFDSSPAMLPMFARAGAAMIPGASRLPFLGGAARAQEIPSLTLTLPSVSVDRDRLAAYDRVCGFSLSDTLPATYPHVLAFPLHLALMTDPSFPFSAVGLVHISNSITQHRPIAAAETLAFRVWPTPLEPHRRGTQFAIRSEASIDGEVVWEEVSTNLRRGAGPPKGSGSGEGEDAGTSGEGQAEGGSPSGDAEHGGQPLPVTATWRLPSDLGRRYAMVSGDMNPIHMHSLAARPFGFPSAIVHGMWTKARCLAALGNRLPGAFTVEVSFKKAILLPSTVQFSESHDRFEVRSADESILHLEGSLR